MADRELAAVRSDMLGYCPNGHGRGEPFSECPVCNASLAMEWAYARRHLDKYRRLDPMASFRHWAQEVLSESKRDGS